MPLQIAVLVKQVPRFESMELGADGRLVREGLELELNPYCRRAVSQGVALAAATGGTCTVLTLGPPAAEDCLREAIAWGATRGVLITDPAFAGSDTLATSRALAAALRTLAAVDLVLTGRNSVDADTAQVPAQIAELLGLPFLGGVRELRLSEDGGTLSVRCEHDDGWMRAEAPLPALLSCAERLIEPAKVDPQGRAAVSPALITRLRAADLGPGPWGQEGSPTRVGEVRSLAVERLGVVLAGDLDTQVRRAVDLMLESGALAAGAEDPPPPVAASSGSEAGPVVAVVVEPDRRRATRELLGAAARIAAQLGGRVVALGPGGLDAAEAGSWGADAVVDLEGAPVEEDVAGAVAGWVAEARPSVMLLGSTMWGREVGSRVAARTSSGLVGDAVDLGVRGGRLVCWKPAFGGGMVAAVTSSSELQMATVRPGVLPLPAGRAAVADTSRRTGEPASSVRVLERGRDDDVDALAAARTVVVVGAGVPPESYPAFRPLLDLLGGEMAATRKVTDRGWMPRARQVGITGRAVAPTLAIEVATSGKFNHTIGTRAAGFVLAVNSDPGALVFGAADAGIVGDWSEVLPRLTAAIAERVAAGAGAPPTRS